MRACAMLSFDLLLKSYSEGAEERFFATAMQVAAHAARRRSGWIRRSVMKTDVDCLRCQMRVSIELTDAELQSSLAPGRADLCPRCAQPVGTGPVRCRSCGRAFQLAFPHWHVRCDLAVGICPACGAPYISPCIC
ncbi:hypothetical protein BE17_17560 [Sorangium cellulosum]|uniref:DZANK-type domain-containing protein n=1 Tax=Sorangium cellulosum TaxID=56 RepID=A0A150SMJ5_SORCE|nr:hypothetical protein BE17_17560 [Sorangium cellulosum]